MAQPMNIPPVVMAEDGEVIVDAPGVVASMTAEAALDLSDTLADAATEARGQQMLRDSKL